MSPPSAINRLACHSLGQIGHGPASTFKYNPLPPDESEGLACVHGQYSPFTGATSGGLTRLGDSTRQGTGEPVPFGRLMPESREVRPRRELDLRHVAAVRAG